MDWFLYDRDLRHERVKKGLKADLSNYIPIFSLIVKNVVHKQTSDYMSQ